MKRAESALQFISPIERDTWVQMGMALQSTYGDAANEIWMDWSRGADSFKESDARAVWRSFRGTGVSVATLFHEAKQNGWNDAGHQQPTRYQIEAQQRAAAERASKDGRERAKTAQVAARKAKWILDQCQHEQHAYLQTKGYPKLQGLVWRPDVETNLLCIPMYVAGNLCGVQMIDKHGVKKYLSGQITSQAQYCIDAGGVGASDWWCEGYASGLSLRDCLSALQLRYRIHITFSAGNLKRMAHSGFAVADNDLSGTGEAAAAATGLPYWMPLTVGADINDFHQEHGTFKASQALRKWIVNQQSIAIGIANGSQGDRPSH
jgi:putative DNA primase/helicase